MIRDLPRNVTDAEKKQYLKDGVVILKGIYPKAWVTRLEAELDDVFTESITRTQSQDNVRDGKRPRGYSTNMVGAVRHAKKANPDAILAIEGDQDDLPDGVSFVETDASHWHAGMRAHNLESPLAEIVHQLTDSKKVNFYSDQLFYKGAGSRVKTPIHQDKPYFLVDGGEVAVAWVPVDHVTKENGAMGYVRGSHKWGKTFKPSDFQTETGTFPEVGDISMAGLDTIDHARIRAEDLIYFDAKPGDVIIHNWATLHGSTGNTSTKNSRRAASVRFACDGCHYHARASSPEPFRNSLGLTEGDPLEAHARFPIVWPRT